ncbi:hypothetical protein MY494_00705 [Synechococcus sp. A10-1-5-1]|uniref:hypothetical protein n=1 Tax=Synechococcus sp. A10-1-5-1 TaxID=2936507 RepID=UPI002000B52E|nr:hypothetical protein [Synechococcus sp. A10-1-5-1]UPM50360.1 hypothetical protein MY494_00705 [Synechococcus sp. A10-1-5-1]
MTRPRLCGLSLAATALSLIFASPALADSALLESVKQNPQKAKSLCAELQGLNARGISYNSPEATAQIAQQQGLNTTDAEILSTYVVGLYCPTVR